MNSLTPTSHDWPERMLLRYGLSTTAELREESATLMNPANREWVDLLADRLESMGLRRLAEVPSDQLALVTVG